MAVWALYRFPVHGKRPFDPRPRRVRSIALEQKLNALRFVSNRSPRGVFALRRRSVFTCVSSLPLNRCPSAALPHLCHRRGFQSGRRWGTAIPSRHRAQLERRSRGSKPCAAPGAAPVRAQLPSQLRGGREYAPVATMQINIANSPIPHTVRPFQAKLRSTDQTENQRVTSCLRMRQASQVTDLVEVLNSSV